MKTNSCSLGVTLVRGLKGNESGPSDRCCWDSGDSSVIIFRIKVPQILVSSSPNTCRDAVCEVACKLC